MRIPQSRSYCNLPGMALLHTRWVNEKKRVEFSLKCFSISSLDVLAALKYKLAALTVVALAKAACYIKHT